MVLEKLHKSIKGGRSSSSNRRSSQKPTSQGKRQSRASSRRSISGPKKASKDNRKRKQPVQRSAPKPRTSVAAKSKSVLKRPAKASAAAKRPSCNAKRAVPMVRKRPASLDTDYVDVSDPGVLKRPASASNERWSSSGCPLVEDMVLEGLRRAEAAGRIPTTPPTPSSRLPGTPREVFAGGRLPGTPKENLGRSPTLPSSFAEPITFDEILNRKPAQGSSRHPSFQCPAPPSSWNATPPSSWVPPSPKKDAAPGSPRASGSRSTGTDDVPGGNVLPNRQRKRKNSTGANTPEPPTEPVANQRKDCVPPPQDGGEQPENAKAPSVKFMKAALESAGVDSSQCLERRDLEKLWHRFLGHQCRAAGAPVPLRPNVRFARRTLPGDVGSDPANREGEAISLAERINRIKSDRFVSNVEWGFAVLDHPERDLASVHKAYRSLTKQLHPDRVGSNADVAAAVEIVREAKDVCEKSLRRQHPPDRPTRLTCVHLCREPGRRQIKIQWKAPESKASSPVHRYIVAVFDPSYGKSLAIATLEPDYSQELKRYLAHDDPELCCYVIAQEELRKMPTLFNSSSLTIQVAAGNNEGQSDWSISRVDLTNKDVAAPRQSLPSRPSLPSKGARPPVPPKSRPSLHISSTSVHCSETTSSGISQFDRGVSELNGRKLEDWLRCQLKTDIQHWLRRRFQPTAGSKEEMVQRIITYKEEDPYDGL